MSASVPDPTAPSDEQIEAADIEALREVMADMRGYYSITAIADYAVRVGGFRRAVAPLPEPEYEWGTLQPNGVGIKWDDEGRARQAALIALSFKPPHPLVRRTAPGPWVPVVEKQES